MNKRAKTADIAYIIRTRVCDLNAGKFERHSKIGIAR